MPITECIASSALQIKVDPGFGRTSSSRGLGVKFWLHSLPDLEVWSERPGSQCP